MAIIYIMVKGITPNTLKRKNGIHLPFLIKRGGKKFKKPYNIYHKVKGKTPKVLITLK